MLEDQDSPTEKYFAAINKEPQKTEEEAPAPKEKIKIKERIRNFFKNPTKRLIFIVIVGLVIVGLVGYGLYSLNKNNNAESSASEAKKKSEEAAKAQYQAPLDGVMTDQDSANRHPLAVIVENHVDARPQAGLDKASVVYETIAEGGITRFLALFGTNDAEKVGPVRSARTYFVDWTEGYQAWIAHVGGNIDALDKIKAEKVADLDQFGYPSPYWREPKANLASEHTMYTSTLRLRDQARINGYSTANNFNIYRFTNDPALELRPATQTVNVAFSNSEYNVRYQYDRETNTYKRFLAGTPHIDQISKNQLAPKNLIVMTVSRKPTTTRINESGYDMTNIGTGAAKIFINGTVINGTWKKQSKTDRELFYDASGNEMVFDRGQFWIDAVAPGDSVTVE